MRRLPALLLPLILLVQADAMAWWNDAWAYRKAITLDTTATGAGVNSDLLDTPVLIRLHTGNFSHFLDLTDGGGDLRFVAGDDKTPLQHHIEKIDVVNELAFIWVKLPAIKGNAGPAPRAAEGAEPAATNTDNKIYLYFGNAEAIGGGTAAATYGPINALVYHFDDASGEPQDRSANALAVLSASGIVSSPSLIGDGVRFPGNGRLNVADAPVLKLDPVAGWGASLWFRMDAPQADAYVLDRVSGSQRLTLAIDGSTLRLNYTDAAGTPHAGAEAQIMLGSWHHLAVTSQNGQFTLYMDGNAMGTLTAGAEPMEGAITLGAAADGSHGLQAELDELRVYAALPSPDTLRFAALSEGMDTPAVGYLADESQDTEGGGESEEGHSSYFGIILNQVFGNDQAIIEQSVIVFCGLMALVAFAVMGLKQAYLMKCRRSSARFLEAYEALGRDQNLESLTRQEETFEASPLFRIYRQGMREVARRVAPGSGARLNDRALLAIKAALDAVMVREGQRLNAQMVLLTIAISGGPFIGLLGTVVGVMVTFAAIAATGDVNINAIAPGMAAALLATTAGLGVAIPSLFGYNYLGSRVKELSADMHVYADELLSRINELHGE
jgi:biopolymer transport protein ExbB